MEELSQLLDASHDFAEQVLAMFTDDIDWYGGGWPEAASAAAELSLEHGLALRALFQVGTPNSASALLRLQYEALVRGAWLLYAAPEAQVNKLSADLSAETADAARNVISAEKMLLALEAVAEKVPNLRGLVDPLREIREVSWKPLNSFVHAGLHALARTQQGYPVEQAVAVVKNSNGLVHMAARLLARTTDSVELASRVDRAYERFAEVLPLVTMPNAAK